MYIDQDQKKRISILEITIDQGEILVDALSIYFECRLLHGLSPDEKAVKILKNDLKTIIGRNQ